MYGSDESKLKIAEDALEVFQLRELDEECKYFQFLNSIQCLFNS